MTEKEILSVINSAKFKVQVHSLWYDVKTISHYTNNGQNTFRVSFVKHGETVSAVVSGNNIKEVLNVKWQPFKPCRPKFKIGDYIKVISKTLDKPPFLNNRMIDNYFKLFKVETIKYGYVVINGDYYHNSLLKKLTKDEYEKELLYKPISNYIKRVIENKEENIRVLTKRKSLAIKDYIKVNREIELINNRTEDIDTLVNKTIDKISTDLIRLSKDKRIKSVKFEKGSNILIIKTDYIKVRSNYLNIQKRFSLLPSLKIKIDLLNNSIEIYLIDRLPIHENISTIHPHVSNNVPCLGDIKSDLYKYMASYNIYMLVMAQLEMLETYNNDSTYLKLPEFFKDVPICKGCDAPTIYKKCPECGQISDLDDDNFTNNI